MGDIKNFFDAKSFAVVGASRDPNKVGHTVFKNLLYKNQKVFPVNPKADQILNQKSYDSLLQIPYLIDCVVIAIPANSFL